MEDMKLTMAVYLYLDINNRVPDDDKVRCYVCGKVIRDTDPPHVELGDGGPFLVVEASDEERATSSFQAGYLGEWPVGPTCWRKIQKSVKSDEGHYTKTYAETVERAKRDDAIDREWKRGRGY